MKISGHPSMIPLFWSAFTRKPGLLCAGFSRTHLKPARAPPARKQARPPGPSSPAGRIPAAMRRQAPPGERGCTRKPRTTCSATSPPQTRFSGHNARPCEEKPGGSALSHLDKFVRRKGEQTDFQRLAQRGNTHRELRAEADARPRGKPLRKLEGDSSAVSASGEDRRYGDMRNEARSSRFA